jgi:Cdc6-like AAA superfamily ATPase
MFHDAVRLCALRCFETSPHTSYNYNARRQIDLRRQVVELASRRHASKRKHPSKRITRAMGTRHRSRRAEMLPFVIE